MKTFPSPTRHGNWRMRDGELVDEPAAGTELTPAEKAADGVIADAAGAEAPAAEVDHAETPQTADDGDDTPPSGGKRRRRKAAASDPDPDPEPTE